jgi:hypothetical protein
MQLRRLYKGEFLLAVVEVLLQADREDWWCLGHAL